MNADMKVFDFFYRNGLSLAFVLLFLISMIGQIITGHSEHNEFLNEFGRPSEALEAYLCSGHFLEATFENWESEFLQMGLFVVLTIYLRQIGSSESKRCDEPNFKTSELRSRKDSPWPVKRKGFVLGVYKHSLSISLFALFLLSFFLHWLGSWISYNEEQTLKPLPTQEFTQYFISSKLWFESFQNWQSEFLSILAIIFLSIYLRQHGSSQSKPVNAPNMETGE